MSLRMLTQLSCMSRVPTTVSITLSCIYALITSIYHQTMTSVMNIDHLAISIAKII
jgi:hypothetical protein